MTGLLAVLLFNPYLSAAEKLIRVRPHLVVSPFSEVKLEQLVDAQNLSEESRKKLSKVTVTKAPELGEKQEISNASLAGLLREIVKTERRGSKESVHLVLPKSVVVDTVKRSMDVELIREELMDAWKPLCSDCKLEIEALSPPAILAIRDWSLKIKAELPKGSFSVPVEIIRQDGSPIQAWVSGRLIVKRKVPVSKRLLNANERLQTQDFDWEYRDTSYSMDTLPSNDELEGKKLRQTLRAGEVLWRHLLEREKAVRRGDVVQLKSGTGNWEVSLSVVAQQDGYVGDVINFKNPKTNSSLMGTVIGQGEVELR